MDFVEQLKSSVDIVKVVGDYVRLRKLGNSYKGLCPFHNERTPSFNVHSVQQYYKCFGCGKGGDLIKFVMEIENVPFYEALTMLAERNGIPMPKRSDYSDPESKLRESLFSAQEIALEHFRQNLHSNNGTQARTYLKNRGLDGALAAEFSLGLSTRSGNALCGLLQQQGFSADQIVESGLALRRDDGGLYDRFRGRLMFPIHNESGKVIGFGGRALEPGDEPKYLNSPATKLYDKSRTLYNLHRARQAARNTDRIVLVEGYMDVIGVWAAGVKEVVATCGTALTNSQVRVLRKYSTNIVLAFDKDDAGNNALEKPAQMLLEENMNIRMLEMPGKLDPADFGKQNEAELLTRLQQWSTVWKHQQLSLPSYFWWLTTRTSTRFNLNEAEGRTAALRSLLPIMHLIPDKIARVAVANDVADYLKLPFGLLRDEFRKSASDRTQPRFDKPRYDLPSAEKMLVHALVQSAQARRQILEELAALPHFQQLAGKHIFESILAIERSGVPFRYGELEARLTEEENTLMAKLAFADDTEEENIIVKQAMACLEELKQRASRERIEALKTEIAAAERSGDMAKALALMQELKRLQARRSDY